MVTARATYCTVSLWATHRSEDMFKHQLILPAQVEAEREDDLCLYGFAADWFYEGFYEF